MAGAKELFYFNLYSPGDMEKTKAFYRKVFGWEIGGGSLGGHVDNAENTPCGIHPGGSNNTVYFITLDLDTTMKEVEENGGSILSLENFDEIGRAAHCQDNQGTNFSLQEPGTPEMKEHAANVRKGSRHGDLFFFSLPVEDGEKAKLFYGAVLGWEFGSKGKQGGLGITNLRGPDGGLGCDRPGHYPSFWFRVENMSIEDATKLVKDSGGIAGDVFDTAEGRMSQCKDDQGVEFGLVQAAPGY